jgi:hypothetical protein
MIWSHFDVPLKSDLEGQQTYLCLGFANIQVRLKRHNKVLPNS